MIERILLAVSVYLDRATYEQLCIVGAVSILVALFVGVWLGATIAAPIYFRRGVRRGKEDQRSFILQRNNSNSRQRL